MTRKSKRREKRRKKLGAREKTICDYCGREYSHKSIDAHVYIDHQEEYDAEYLRYANSSND